MKKVGKYVGLKGKIIALPNQADSTKTYTAGKIVSKQKVS